METNYYVRRVTGKKEIGNEIRMHACEKYRSSNIKFSLFIFFTFDFRCYMPQHISSFPIYFYRFKCYFVYDLFNTK